MLNTFLDSVNTLEINLLNASFRLVLSLLLGAAIGLERKHKGQKAGMRTFALISMGATLAMLLSIYIPQVYMGLKNGDPERIAAQVVSGVGFLGAGAIIQSKGSIRGLTTAAGIWVTAMIGMAVGAGLYLISIIATILILFTLIIIDRYEHQWHIGWETKIVRLKLGVMIDDIDIYKSLFSKYNVHLSDNYIRYDYTHQVTIINFMIRTQGNTNFVRLFDEMNGLNPNTHSITLTDEVNN